MLTRKLFILASLLALFGIACGGGQTTTDTTDPVTNNTEPDAVKPADELPTAEAILAKYVEASGGADAFKAIKSYKVTGIFAIPKQKIEAELSIQAAANAFLVEIKIPGIGTERVGSDGNTSWSMSAMTGSRILEGAELEQMKREVDLLSDVNWKSYYKSAKTAGKEDLDGKSVFVVEMIDNQDLKETRYFDAESGLLLRQTGTNKSQMGEMKSDSRFSDYEKFGDVLMAKTTTVDSMGMQQVITTKGVEINIDIDNKTFELPDEIKKLVDAKGAP